MSRNPHCPACGSSQHVEQELGRDAQGRLDVFAESTVYICAAFGTPNDRGCGRRWEEVARAIGAAREAVAAIPVTDSTVSVRAKALNQLDGLIDERALGKARVAS